ncbi:YbaB/EbfC family nucleoid-associated protein [Nonomuraea antimicrobica]
MFREAQQHFVQAQELQQRISAAVGRAQARNRLVAVDFNGEGIVKLELDPRVMRMPSADLADLIVATSRDAARDFQRQVNGLMGAMFGENDDLAALISDPAAAMAELKNAERAYDHAFQEVLGELARIRELDD